MIVTGNQILAHLIGDYLLQSDWMARNKRTDIFACMIHAVMYTLPFPLLIDGVEPYALFWIFVSHFVIDHFALAGYMIRLRNMLGDGMEPWSRRMRITFGFESGTPDHVKFFVFVLVDNTMHLLCNAIALNYF